MIIKLLKYLMGYVVFDAKGGFCERFINLCSMRRINLWDVSLQGDTINAKIDMKKFRKLRTVARKTGVRISIVQKRGLPFYLRNHRDRVGLLIGLGVFIFFMTVMNSFVWCIHSVDSEKFSHEQIMEAAYNAGLHYGVRVKNFDEEKAAREIYKAFDGELSWVKVNIKGSLAVVDFRDKVKKIEIEEKGEPSNLVADFDGIIISDETYQGSKNKSRGDAVIKGDVLISGVVEGVDMKPLYYESKGKFSALHTVESKTVLSKNQEFYAYDSQEKQYTLLVFGIKIPMSFLGDSAENSHKFTYESNMQFDGYKLPVGIKKTLTVNYNKAQISDRELKLFAILRYSDETYKQFSNSNILSYNVNVAEEKRATTVTGEYQCIDFIGENRVIIIENSEIS